MGIEKEDDRPIRHIFRWDLDKTYLDTDLRLSTVWRIPFEEPADKRNVPGVVALLRALRAPVEASQRSVVTFISGSPRQMRATLEAKFQLDGFAPDSLLLKPNLDNFVRLRWGAIREQIGYKVPRLLAARVHIPAHVPETCFGDDSESDAFIYSLYADLLSGIAGDHTLSRALKAVGALKNDLLQARSMRRRLLQGDAVKKIFIHLAMESPPARFAVYGRRVVPVRDYFQATLCLFESGLVDVQGVLEVTHDLLTRYRFTEERLMLSLVDIVWRGFVSPHGLERLHASLEPAQLLSVAPHMSRAMTALRQLPVLSFEPRFTDDREAPIDYGRLIHNLERYGHAEGVKLSSPRDRR